MQAFACGNHLTKLFVAEVLFPIFFRELRAAVFFNFVSRCNLQELAPVVGAGVLGAAIF